MWWLIAGVLIDWKWVGSVLLVSLLVIAITVGVHVQPWSPWWFARGDVGAIVLNNDVPVVQNAQNVQTDVRGGRVTDLDRYSLARAAGFSGPDAITATAISIAEDGSGDPAALSPPNRDGSRDLGLWQINSGWWSQFGGHDALIVPINNARAAFVIFGRQGWCAWSVYEARCGPGHTGAYFGNLGRARAAAAIYGQ
jgi:hypothetical protein